MYGYLGAVLQEKGRNVYTITPEASVKDAVRTMNEKGVGALLVMRGDQVCGIFTERDVLRRVVDGARNPAQTLVGAVMTPEPIAVTLRMPTQEAMQLMTARRCRHLPVVDDEGGLVGIVSIGDLLRWVSMHQEEHIQRLAEYITGAEPIAARAEGP